MICPKCGTTLKEGAKFCGKCGSKVGEAPSKPETNKVQETKRPIPISEAQAAAAKDLPPKKKSGCLVIVLVIVALSAVMGIGGSVIYHRNKRNEAASLESVQAKDEADKEDSRKNRKKEKDKEKEGSERVETTTAQPETDTSSAYTTAFAEQTTEDTTMAETTAMPEAEPVTAAVQYAAQTSFDNLMRAGVLVDTAYESSHVVQEDSIIDNSGWSAFDGDEVTSWQEGVEGDGIDEYVGISFDREYQVEVITLLLGNHRSDSWYVKNNTPKTLTINLSGKVFQITFPKEKTEFAVVLSSPVAASDIRLTIDSVYSGTEYTDTIIAEVGVYGN